MGFYYGPMDPVWVCHFHFMSFPYSCCDMPRVMHGASIEYHQNAYERRANVPTQKSNNVYHQTTPSATGPLAYCSPRTAAPG